MNPYDHIETPPDYRDTFTRREGRVYRLPYHVLMVRKPHLPYGWHVYHWDTRTEAESWNWHWRENLKLVTIVQSDPRWN